MRGFRRRGDEPPRAHAGDGATDAHPAADHPRRLARDPEARRRARRRKRAVRLLWGVAFAAGLLTALLGDGGYADLTRLRTEAESMHEQLAEQRARVARLQDEIVRLQTDPAARERIAREQLGLVLPGEIDFLLPRQGHSSFPAP
jgi:cell division protein FtsB